MKNIPIIPGELIIFINFLDHTNNESDLLSKQKYIAASACIWHGESELKNVDAHDARLPHFIRV